MKKTELVQTARRFLKHQVYGTVYAVVMTNTGEVLGARVATEATACAHTLASAELDFPIDEVEAINKNLDDYDVFEPRCSDAQHLLADLGTQEQACQVARNEWLVARSRAKELKDALDKAEAQLRLMVRDATTAEQPQLPLFERTPSPGDAPAAGEQAGA